MPRLIKLYFTAHLAIVWGLCFIAQNPEGVKRGKMPLRAPNFTGKYVPWETSVNCGDKTQSLISGYSGTISLFDAPRSETLWAQGQGSNIV